MFGFSAFRPCLIAALGLALTACGIPDAGRPDSNGRGSAGARPSTQTPAISSAPETRACHAQLGTIGARFTPLPDRYLGAGCSQIGTVQLQAMAGDAGQLAATNLGPVSCPVAETFANWARFAVDRAARQHLGSPLASIETFGSYSCRNVAGSGRRSAHATSEAIDVSAFVLADGRRIVLLQDWDNGGAAERQFLRAVKASACRRFDTVLGPEYNAAHRDHFHFEGVRSGQGFCR